LGRARGGGHRPLGVRAYPRILKSTLPRRWTDSLALEPAALPPGYCGGALFGMDCSGAAGRRTRTVRPPSCLGAAWTSPPCALATERTIDRPSPAPRLVEEA